jgi:hypothetical protein
MKRNCFSIRVRLDVRRVKRRNTLAEHMFSALAPTTDMLWLHSNDRFVPWRFLDAGRKSALIV